MEILYDTIDKRSNLCYNMIVICGNLAKIIRARRLLIKNLC